MQHKISRIVRELGIKEATRILNYAEKLHCININIAVQSSLSATGSAFLYDDQRFVNLDHLELTLIDLRTLKGVEWLEIAVGD